MLPGGVRDIIFESNEVESPDYPKKNEFLDSRKRRRDNSGEMRQLLAGGGLGNRIQKWIDIEIQKPSTSHIAESQILKDVRRLGRKTKGSETGLKMKYLEEEIEGLIKQNDYLQRLNSKIVNQNAVDSFITGAEILRLRSIIQDLLSQNDSKVRDTGLDALTDHYNEEIDRLNQLLKESRDQRSRSKSRGANSRGQSPGIRKDTTSEG